MRIYKLGPQGQEQTLTELGDRTVFTAQRLQGAYGQAVEPVTIITLSEQELKSVDAEIRQRITDAADFALSDPEPDVSELWTDVYVAA